MITRVLSICDFGSFTDFDWNQVVRDKGNNVIDFGRLNILYGRNYSGKTTLSRIVDSFDKQCLPEDYSSGSFQISHSECGLLCEKDLEATNIKVKVYNTDFVKKNLGLLHDKNGEIIPFAIVGEKNVEIKRKIDSLKKDIGDDDSGLTKKLLDAQSDEIKKSKNFNLADKELQKALKNKAKDIKENSVLYNDPNYIVTSIKKDIKAIQKNDYALTNEERTENIQTANETSKPEIPQILVKTPNYESLLDKAKDLLAREVKPSKSIQELLADTELQEWVRKGAPHHRDKRSTCAFCGNKLPEDLWDKIDSHFNRESEELRSSLEEMQTIIDDEIKLFRPKVAVPGISIYAQLSKKMDFHISRCNSLSKEYINSLENLGNALQARLKDIFRPIDYKENFDACQKISKAHQAINAVIEKNNQITTNLSSQKNQARRLLRLDTIQSFLETIDYTAKIKKKDDLEKLASSAVETTKLIDKEVRTKKAEINTLKNELSDERKGAAKVNDYLNHYFGHKALELSPETGSEGSKFVLMRDGEHASNLSEGECSLVAFCYFMAKLHEVGSEAEDSIIWIDDPISSLDNNHVFFIFSLIESQLAKDKRYGQLFISTHNLGFLKYLKKMTAPTRTEGGKRYFLIENDNRCSRILLMPKYLESYTTEFNYLFDMIHKCSIQTDEDDEQFDYYYNFGNNLRKFLESYLFYKYPDQSDLYTKVSLFFDPDHESTALIFRLVNEYSHLLEAVERSTKPIDVPEMKKVANYVLDTIKSRDEDQYNSLLVSIGVAV